jgi:addiction module RelE/StbE family toxin
MRITYHKNFKKSFNKLSAKSREKLWQNIEIFTIDQFDRRLNNHPLKGKYANYHSINIGGDLRAVYKQIDSELIFFIEINTHSELY